MENFPPEIWLLVAKNLDRAATLSLSKTCLYLSSLMRSKLLGYRLLYSLERDGECAALDFMKAHTFIDLCVSDNKNKTVLALIAERGYRDIICLLLTNPQAKKLLNACGTSGDTPLILAAQHNHLPIVSALLNAGANVNARNEIGQTALYWAIKNGNYSIVAALLDMNADTTIHGRSALWTAAQTRNLSISELLICKGESPDAQDLSREPLLCWAVKRHYDSYVQLLLTQGADPGRADRIRRSPLTCAASSGNVRIAKELLSHGANLATVDRCGRTPLAWAVIMGHVEMVQMLLDRGAGLDTVDQFGWTPLARATAQEDVDMTGLLLARGASPQHVEDRVQCPLMWAAVKKNVTLARMLLDKGADPMRLDGYSWSPLMVAVQNQDTAMVQLLITTSSHAVDVKLNNMYGDSALSLACDLSASSILKVLQS
jgi:ankyrin repeat protein